MGKKKPKETKGNSKGLTERQLKAIPFLISSSTYEEGRKRARIGKKTLYEWLKDPGFKAELKRRRNEIVKEAFDVLRDNITRAVRTLVGLLDTTRPETKRRVANDIINLTLKDKELQDIEKRLDNIEKTLQELKVSKEA